jgi:hypothetical protein
MDYLFFEVKLNLYRIKAIKLGLIFANILYIMKILM